jgi:hypothetical protein
VHVDAERAAKATAGRAGADGLLKLKRPGVGAGSVMPQSAQRQSVEKESARLARRFDHRD